jgi:hypothetical protein
MSPSGEIWPRKPRVVAGSPTSPKWMFSSRPRVGRVALGHVLLEHLDRRGALHEHRAEVADERRHDVAPLEREAAAHRVGLLAERAEEPADDLGLPEGLRQDVEPARSVSKALHIGGGQIASEVRPSSRIV